MCYNGIDGVATFTSTYYMCGKCNVFVKENTKHTRCVKVYQIQITDAGNQKTVCLLGPLTSKQVDKYLKKVFDDVKKHPCLNIKLAASSLKWVNYEDKPGMWNEAYGFPGTVEVR